MYVSGWGYPPRAGRSDPIQKEKDDFYGKHIQLEGTKNVQFEWDEAKRVSNYQKHGVDFLDAALIFDGNVLTKRDDTKDYGEDRFNSLGLVDGQVYNVTHTERDGKIRIISAWKGGRKEHEYYKTRVP